MPESLIYLRRSSDSEPAGLVPFPLLPPSSAVGPAERYHEGRSEGAKGRRPAWQSVRPSPFHLGPLCQRCRDFARHRSVRHDFAITHTERGRRRRAPRTLREWAQKKRQQCRVERGAANHDRGGIIRDKRVKVTWADRRRHVLKLHGARPSARQIIEGRLTVSQSICPSALQPFSGEVDLFSDKRYVDRWVTAFLPPSLPPSHLLDV